MFWFRRRPIEDAFSRVLTSQIQREYFAVFFFLVKKCLNRHCCDIGYFHLDYIFDEDKENNA